MISFLKAQLNSIISTAVDFLVMIVLVEFFSIYYIAAVVAGAIAGAMTNFILGRVWVFQAKNESVKEQILKYSLVWTGSLLLNICGVYFFTDILKVKYIISKIITSITVGVSFNYILQKRFVFSVK
ncbi:MAG: GtrA family protein [Bacteroidia bacterium]